MSNHIHLLIQAQIAADLAKFMKSILQVYANQFRSKYRSVGYIFQNIPGVVFLIMQRDRRMAIWRLL